MQNDKKLINFVCKGKSRQNRSKFYYKIFSKKNCF